MTAADYQFNGLPTTLKAGATVFQLTDSAPLEHHEMVIFRRKPGVTDKATKFLGLSQKQALKKLEPVDSAGETSPGQTSYAITNLTPGQYIATCFLTQGGKKKGKGHYQLGMITEFTVS